MLRVAQPATRTRRPGPELAADVESAFDRLTRLLDQRLTLSQHRDVLEQQGG
jgi:hypothetical protein